MTLTINQCHRYCGIR